MSVSVSGPQENPPSPVVNSARIRGQLRALIQHLDADRTRVDDPRFCALLQAAAETLKGIHTAFVNYDEGRRKNLHLSQ